MITKMIGLNHSAIYQATKCDFAHISCSIFLRYMGFDSLRDWFRYTTLRMSRTWIFDGLNFYMLKESFIFLYTLL